MNDLEMNYPSLKFHRLLINSFTSYKILEDIELNIKKLKSSKLGEFIKRYSMHQKIAADAIKVTS